MRTTSVPTYWAKIFVATDPYTKAAVSEVCANYVDSVGLCVTVSDTQYIYTNGNEDGVVVGLINYPRFPQKPAVIRRRALALAAILKKRMKQRRVTVEFPDETVLLGGIR
jgi:hypothetical protein